MKTIAEKYNEQLEIIEAYSSFIQEMQQIFDVALVDVSPAIKLRTMRRMFKHEQTKLVTELSRIMLGATFVAQASGDDIERAIVEKIAEG